MGFFRRIVRPLARLLAPRRAPPAPPPGEAGAGRRRTSLENRLGTMIEVKSPRAAGSVFWLGLKEFRERFAKRWATVGPRIDAIAQRCIENRLTDPDDTYEKHGDNYAIVFARLTKSEANLQCALIAKDISDRLLGEFDSPETVSVGSAVIEFDRETVERIAADGGPLRLLDEEARRRQTRYARGEGALISLEDALAEVKIVYRPMWNTRHNVISSYRCLPTRRSNEGRLLYGEELIPARGLDTLLVTQAMTPLLDAIVFKKAVGVLKRVTARGAVNVMVVPVHFSTLKEKTLREEYRKALYAIPPQLHNLLVFEILGTEDEADFLGLFDPILLLKPGCRAIILNQPIGRTDFAALQHMGIHSVGIDVGAGPGPEAEIMRKMQRFAENANRSGFRTYVQGIETLSLATAAVGAGFDFVSGMVIASLEEAMAAPKGIRAFSLEDLFTGAYLRAHARADATPDRDATAAAPAAPVAPPCDALGELTRRFMDENGLSEADARILATAKLGAEAGAAP